MQLVRRHGDVVRVRLGPTTYFLVVHPDDVQQILETHADRFERVAGERRVSRRFVGEALFSTEGSTHVAERSILEPIMYGSAAARTAPGVADLATRWAEGLRVDEPVDVWAAMERFCTELAVRVFVGDDPGTGRGRAIVEALQRTVAAMDALPLAPTSFPDVVPGVDRRFRRERARLDALLEDAIEEPARAPGDDVLSMLAQAGGEDAIGDRIRLRNQVVTLYRGHTATSTAIALTWWQLASEPEAEARMLAEVDGATGDPPDVDALSFTRMAFQESLRRFPPAWILARRAVVPHGAGGHTIPPGARVLLSQWVTHRDARFWPEPDAFRPERFLPEAEAPRHPYAYFPQGAGDKLCMGKHFVVPMEAPIVLATVARRIRFRLAPGPEVRLAPRATLKPRSGVWLIPERRSQTGRSD